MSRGFPRGARSEAGLPSRCVCCTSWCTRPENGEPRALSVRHLSFLLQTMLDFLSDQGEWAQTPDLSPRREQCRLGADVGTNSGWGGRCPQLSPSSRPAPPPETPLLPRAAALFLRLAYGMASPRLCPCLIKHKHQSVTFTWRKHDSQELCSVSFQMTMWYPAPRWDVQAGPMPLLPLVASPSRAASF